MQISFIIPSRNNLKYFKWAYNSIRKNQGDHEVFICAADDASTDGTAEYFEQLALHDPYFQYIVNPGPTRVGHTILYDRIVKELVKTDIAIIWHADMYLCPGAMNEIEKLMYTSKYGIDKIIPIENGERHESKFHLTPNYKTIVSLTRIEPPLHPDGPEKYLADWGVEPEQFNETAFLQWFASPEADGYKPKYNPPYTEGIFAPWAFFVKDFLEIGGHDPLYRPQSKEDSDIFNRFKLNGCKFIQTWIGCTYHMTCRGSRFNPTLTTPGTNSLEWEAHNIRSARNFIRKWGCFVEHTELLEPIVHKRYLVEFRMKNATISAVSLLEPYCDSLRCDLSNKALHDYLSKEQLNTDFDLGFKISGNLLCSIVVYFDCNNLSKEDVFTLEHIPHILSSIKELSAGKYYVTNSISMQIMNVDDITQTLIDVKNPEYRIRLKS